MEVKYTEKNIWKKYIQKYTCINYYTNLKNHVISKWILILIVNTIMKLD